jgi:hypothetical protein
MDSAVAVGDFANTIQRTSRSYVCLAHKCIKKNKKRIKTKTESLTKANKARKKREPKEVFFPSQVVAHRVVVFTTQTASALSRYSTILRCLLERALVHLQSLPHSHHCHKITLRTFIGLLQILGVRPFCLLCAFSDF